MISVTILAYAFSFYRITETLYFTKENGTGLFNYFAVKFNRYYKNHAERQRGLQNFVKNMNIILNLNENSKDNNNSGRFVANMYADTNPKEFEERYAISLKPCE